jgi:hypothetical protein
MLMMKTSLMLLAAALAGAAQAADSSGDSSLAMAVGTLGDTVQAENGTTVFLGTEYNPDKCVLQFLSLECDDNCAELNGWELTCNKKGKQDGVEKKMCECGDVEASQCQSQANPNATSGTVAQFGDCSSAECVDSYGYISTSTEEGPICAEKLHCVQEVNTTATEPASICHTCMSCIAQNSAADEALAGVKRFNCTAICPQEVLDTIAEKNAAGVGIADAVPSASGSESAGGSASVSGSAGSGSTTSGSTAASGSNAAGVRLSGASAALSIAIGALGAALVMA